MEWIERLAGNLPKVEQLGIVKDYHIDKLKGIVTDKYRAKSRKHRDYLMSSKFSEYVEAIHDLSYAFELQKAKGFEPNKVVKTTNYNACYHCGKEDSIKMLSDIAKDKRYQCTNCGAVHVPEGENVNVFYVEEDPQINQFTEIPQDAN